MTSISILGLGWLGFPLGKQLVQKGHTVLGTTTTPEKLEAIREAGIQGFLSTLAQNEIDSLPDHFWKSPILVVCVPPSAFSTDPKAQMEKVCHLAMQGGVERIIYISSTSVYPDVNRAVEVEDAQPETPSGKRVLALEQTLLHEWEGEAVVLRFAGLFGPARHPGRFLAGKKDLPNGNAPVNMIHLEDCITAIEAAMAIGNPTGVFHLASPDHPTRQAFYTQAARLLGLSEPTFNEVSDPSFKWVNPGQFEAQFGIRLQHRDLLESLQTL